VRLPYNLRPRRQFLLLENNPAMMTNFITRMLFYDVD